jgi:hypothetical protein
MLGSSAHIDIRNHGIPPLTLGIAPMTNNAQIANNAINILMNVIEAEIALHPHGMSNAKLAKALDIQSDHKGVHKNYFSWVILQTLTNNGRLVKSNDATPRYTVS